MVSFRTIITSALALAAPIAAQATIAQVVEGLEGLTQQAAALQAPAQSITTVNGPLIIVGQGPFPQIIAGLSDIAKTGATFIEQSKTIHPHPSDADMDAILQAYTQFANVNTQLFNILMGKAGLFSTVPFIGQPVAASLRQVDGVYDTLSLQLVHNLPHQATELQALYDSLSATLETTIMAYQGLAGLKKRSLRYGLREILNEA